MLYERVAGPLLFSYAGGDAEAAHDLTVRALSVAARRPRMLAAIRRAVGVADGPTRTAFGLRFPNPVGLAAGMDKDGLAVPAWAALGFGYVEVGTVTGRPQPGNPRPRLTRLPASEAIINRMGFNNAGAAALAARLSAAGPPPVPVGISIGRSRLTPSGAAVGDYLDCLRAVHPHADYLAVNVSSPNTPGLRSLQDRGLLTELLTALRAALLAAGGGPGGGPKPLLVKIAPDLAQPALADLLAVCAGHGVSGIIATNTTTARGGLAATDAAAGRREGGLSGRPLHPAALSTVAFVTRETGAAMPIIGVGGITEPADAVRMLDAGACLVQLYTGLVYRGPALVRAINRTLAVTHPPVAGHRRAAGHRRGDAQW